MKLLFIGSLINDQTIDEIVKKSKVKPSNAPVNFENMLIKGLEINEVDTTVVSIPTVSTYPGGCMLAWGRRREKTNFGKELIWIPCINLLGLKQLMSTIGSYIEIIKWAFQNRRCKDKAIMNYSVYPPYSKATQVMGKIFHIKTCCIVTDLPEYLYKMGQAHGLKNILNNYYSKKMKRLQTGFDSYVLLTKHMEKRMKIEDKPTMLMEGFADASIFTRIRDVEKNKRKTIMYAGSLNKSFNIRALVEAFMSIDGEYELWLFGSGDQVNYIKECTNEDSRITYFGKVDREILLEHQKAAHLLISVKSPYEDHANYAFPSKILEYMTSGTAVASTKVGGIPEEYFNYIFPIDGDEADGIRKALEKYLELPEKELKKAGENARKYALDSKNYIVQGKRIKEFLETSV